MKKVLIVEDDRNIASALAIRLRSAGYQALTAFDAVSGGQMAAKHTPDLVLLDISMPGGSGLLVAQRLRNRSDTALTPIIFLTASKEPGLREKAMEFGGTEFFEKPYDAAKLMRAINLVLGVPVDVNGPSTRAA